MRLAFLLVLLVLASVARAADVEITALPYTASTDGNRYYLSANETWASGVGITLSCSTCELDMAGFSIENTLGTDLIGVSVTSGETAVTISDATLINCRMLVDSPATISGVTIQENPYNVEAALRFSANADGSTITSSKVHKGDSGGSSQPAIYLRSGCTNLRIEDCLIISDTNYGILVDDNCTGLEVVGCAFDGFDLSSSCLRVSLSSGTMLLANTIIRGSTSSSAVNFTNAAFSGLTHTSNRYFGSTNLVIYGGVTYTSANLTTFEATALSGDPLWPNDNQTLSGDYSLGSGSTSIDAGDSTYTETVVDLIGNTRNVGTDVDQGPIENQGGGGGDPTGGCCVGTVCSITTEAECAETYLGNGTTCTGDPCGSGCDYVITDGNDIVDGSINCIDGGADRKRTAPASGDMFDVSGTTDLTIIRPYHGTYGDTLYFPEGSDRILESFGDAPVLFEGFVIESDYEIPAIFSRGGNLTVRDVKGGCFAISVSTTASTPPLVADNVIIDNVSIDCMTVPSEAVVSVSGKNNISFCGFSGPDSTGSSTQHQLYDPYVASATIRDLWIAHVPVDSVYSATHGRVIADSSENYTLRLSGIDSLVMDDCSFFVDAEEHGERNVTVLQLIAMVDAAIDSVWIRSIGDMMEQSFVMRGTTDAIAYDDNLEEYFQCGTSSTHGCQLSNIWIYAESGDGLSIDGYDTWIDGLRTFVPGNGPSTRGGLRFTEKLWGLQANDVLVVATHPDGRAIDWEAGGFPVDNSLVGWHKLRNVTAITRNKPALAIEGRMSGFNILGDNCVFIRTGSGAVIEIEDAAPDSLALRNSILSGLSSTNAVSIDFDPYSLAQLDAAFPEAAGHAVSGNLWVSNPDDIIVDITYDSLGTYSLVDASSPVDFGSDALLAPYDVLVLDIDLNDRTVSASTDAGAFEYQSGASGGACCSVTGACTILSESSCLALGSGYTYEGDGTDCDPNPCPTNLGACCIVDGWVCVVETQAECLARPGSRAWTAGVDCAPDPCLDRGSCCSPTGNCTVGLEPNCLANGNVWTPGVDCTPNPCPQPGACCIVDGHQCEVVQPEACAELGGDYQGDDVPCQPETCPVLGACCAIDGTCVVTTVAACEDTWTTSVDCDPNPCSVGGACCDPVTGACVVLLQEDCEAGGDVFSGEGTDCSPNLCTVPTGACCVADTLCYEALSEAECETDSLGTWFAGVTCDDVGTACAPMGACCLDGECIGVVTRDACDTAGGEFSLGQTCGEVTCAQPEGACCIAEACSITTAAGCAGVYQGNGTDCDPTPCPQPDGSGACCDPATGGCVIATLDVCFGALFGDYQGDDTVCFPNPCPQPEGTCCNLITGDCTIVTQAECVATNGGYWSGGPECSAGSCPDLVGACCLLETPSLCTITTETTCEDYAGIFQGGQTDCEPDPCTGYFLLAGSVVTDEASTTFLWSLFPNSKQYADTLVDCRVVSGDRRYAVARFDLPASVAVTSVLDCTVDYVLGTMGSEATAPSDLETYHLARTPVITEADWLEWATGQTWATSGASHIPQDYTLPLLSTVPVQDMAPGDTMRVVSGERGLHLARTYLVPDGTVSLISKPEAGALEIYGGASTRPPVLTLTYVAWDGTRRRIQILARGDGGYWVR